MPFWMENYFKRENYLVIDNKPVLFVFNPNRLANECFASAESQKKTFDACREYAKKCGFDGMVIAACDTSGDPARLQEMLSRGYDFRFGYASGYRPAADNADSDETIVQKQCEILKNRLSLDPMRFLATASCFWDPTPRFSDRWNSLGYNFRASNIWYLKPENFRKVIRGMKEITDSLPDGAWGKRIMMIDNWNEWDEGHFVSPSHQFGFKYLQAIREELTERDNLPDYRTPQDQGFTGYNTSWKTPDFAEFCKKKLEEK